MELDRKGLKDKAAQLIRGNYWNMVAAGFVMTAASGKLSIDYGDPLIESVRDMLASLEGALNLMIFGVCLIVFLLVMFPLVCGCAGFFMRSTREKTNLSVLLEGYKKGNWARIITAQLYRMGVVLLHFLLFIIPGIMKCYDYYFVTYLMLEYPELNAKQLCELSRKKARGHRRELLVLDLSFLLWGIASTLTYGLVGIFYTCPYRSQTIALAWNALCEEEVLAETEGSGVAMTADAQAA